MLQRVDVSERSMHTVSANGSVRSKGEKFLSSLHRNSSVKRRGYHNKYVNCTYYERAISAQKLGGTTKHYRPIEAIGLFFYSLGNATAKSCYAYIKFY